MLQLIHSLLQFLDPILTPLCFFLAWTFILLLGWTLWASIRDTTQRAREMHRIPCTRCQFFTNSYQLKCTVRPSVANTEQAIYCSDFCPHS